LESGRTGGHRESVAESAKGSDGEARCV
jgi:hypothetical protein